MAWAQLGTNLLPKTEDTTFVWKSSETPKDKVSFSFKQFHFILLSVSVHLAKITDVTGKKPKDPLS